MGRHKSRKFIDKKHDTIHSFRVVQRSQKDPLVADETAPQSVLVDAQNAESYNEELQNYGIYFDDDYDYLQHLRGVKEAIDWEENDVEVYTIRKEDLSEDRSTQKGGVGLVLPSSAFESYVEEPIGLLNRAAPITGPRPELDPDIVAELDSDDDLGNGDDYDPNDEEGFPDDFVSLLNSKEENCEGLDANVEGYEDIHHWLRGSTQICDDTPNGADTSYRMGVIREDDGSSDESESSSRNYFFLSDEEKDEVASLPNCSTKRRTLSEATSRVSASSSTVPRSELLSILDERFDRLYNDEYTDDKIGPLDGEIIEGPLDVNSEVFQQAIDATKRQFKRGLFSDPADEEWDRTVKWVKERMVIQDNAEEEKEVILIEDKPKPQFDCESILSTYSTTANRPHLIDDRFLFKTNKSKLTKKAIQRHNKEEGDDDLPPNDAETLTLLSCISAISVRPKDETPEDKRERKGALKELRRERRKEKKHNQLAFKEEMKKQRKLSANALRGRVIPVV